MKYIPYGRQSIGRLDVSAVTDVLSSDWLTQGPKVKEFENALCKYTGAKYAVCVSSGTAALHIACLAAGLKKGDEAITSPITFAASANCVLYAQAKPVFADIEEDTANIDPKEIKKKITKKTKAVIPVHFAGHPCQMRQIYRLAKKHKLVVIEDACHALGAEYEGLRIGSCKHSDMAVFSFHPVKSITTGEGGAITTNSKKYYELLLMLRTHGITKETAKLGNKSEGPWYYEMQELGFNYRITDFQCALGISQLNKLDNFLRHRRKISGIYSRKLLNIGMKMILPVENNNVKSSWHIYCIRVSNSLARRRLFDYLRKNGIGAQVHYLPVYMHPYYQGIGYKGLVLPKSEKFYDTVLSIPLYPGLQEKEAEFVINKIVDFMKVKVN